MQISARYRHPCCPQKYNSRDRNAPEQNILQITPLPGRGDPTLSATRVSFIMPDKQNETTLPETFKERAGRPVGRDRYRFRTGRTRQEKRCGPLKQARDTEQQRNVSDQTKRPPMTRNDPFPKPGDLQKEWRPMHRRYRGHIQPLEQDHQIRFLHF
jgi:hypothetical protein